MSERSRSKPDLRQIIDPIAIPAIMFALSLIVIGTATSSAFMGVFNVSNVLIQTTPLLLITLGQMIVIGSKGIDLSVGSTASLAGVIAAMLFEPMGATVALSCGLLAAVVVGLVNGVLVSIGLEPFLVTIATQSAVQGLAFLITPVPDGSVPLWFARITAADIWVGIPNALPFVLVAALFVTAFLKYSKSGADILAVGGDYDVAKLLGVRNARTLIKAYVMSSFLAGLAGLFLIARMRSGGPTVGSSFALGSLAAAVVGGAMLTGGRVSTLGAVFGAFSLGLLPNVMNLAGVPTYYQTATKGAVLLLAILLPVVISRIAESVRNSRRQRFHPVRGIPASAKAI